MWIFDDNVHTDIETWYFLPDYYILWISCRLDVYARKNPKHM